MYIQYGPGYIATFGHQTYKTFVDSFSDSLCMFTSVKENNIFMVPPYQPLENVYINTL